MESFKSQNGPLNLVLLLLFSRHGWETGTPWLSSLAKITLTVSGGVRLKCRWFPRLPESLFFLLPASNHLLLLTDILPFSSFPFSNIKTLTVCVFMWLSNRPLCIRTTSSLAVELLVVVSVASVSWLLSIVLLWTLVWCFFLNYGFLWIYAQERDSTGSNGSSIFSLKNLHPVLHVAAPIYIPPKSLGGFLCLHTWGIHFLSPSYLCPYLHRSL